MCIAAYREALTRELLCTVSADPAPAADPVLPADPAPAARKTSCAEAAPDETVHAH
jgi:hypothetical protein